MTFSQQSLFQQYAPLPQPQSEQQRDAGRESEQRSYCIQQGTVEISEQDLEKTITAHVTPMNDRGQLGAPTKVELNIDHGREVSFHHQLPLSARRAFLSVDDEQLGSWEAVVDLNWCRFNRRGYYTSGGRFAQPAERSA